MEIVWWIIGFVVSVAIAAIGWWDSIRKADQLRVLEIKNNKLLRKYKDTAARNVKLAAKAAETEKLNKKIEDLKKEVSIDANAHNLIDYVLERNAESTNAIDPDKEPTVSDRDYRQSTKPSRVARRPTGSHKKR